MKMMCLGCLIPDDMKMFYHRETLDNRSISQKHEDTDEAVMMHTPDKAD